MANFEHPKKQIKNYFTSFPSLSKAINSDFFMDLDIHVYLEDIQEAITPLIVKISLFMDLNFLVLDIELASLYLSNIAEYLI